MKVVMKNSIFFSCLNRIVIEIKEVNWCKEKILTINS